MRREEREAEWKKEVTFFFGWQRPLKLSKMEGGWSFCEGREVRKKRGKIVLTRWPLKTN